MDYVFSPWRYRYVSEARAEDACVLCLKLAEANDAENFVLYRGRANAVILNLYPYTSGHLMVLPYAHVGSLEACEPAVRSEMMELTARAEGILRREYHPDGLNLGMNLGEASGAGIAGHIHMHVLPRWHGDTNFMTVVAETRVLPEDVARSYARLRPYFEGLATGGV